MFKMKNFFFKYLMLTMIFSGFISFAQASEYTQLEWTTGVSGTLHMGDNMTFNGYTVTVIDLPPPVISDKYKQIPDEPVEPFVGLNISKNGIFLDTVMLTQGSSFVASDSELQIVVKQLPSKDSNVWLYESYSPWVTIELNPRGKPGLDVSISSEAQYISSSTTDIVASMTIKNTGSADLLNVDAIVLTKLQIKEGELKYHFTSIKKQETKVESVTFSCPIVDQKTSFEISINATGYDGKEIQYKAGNIKTITVMPESLNIPTLKKTTNPKMYLKDNSMIILNLKNNAKYELQNISISDSIPVNFTVVGNNSLHWTINISAFGEWDIHYLIKPQESTIKPIALPAASAEFKLNNEYNMVQSNRPQLMVYGPIIVLTKQTNAQEANPGEKINVTVTGENKGSTPTKIIINDQLPQGMSVVSGTMNKEAFLEAGKKVSFSYVLKMDSKKSIKLPPATADYYELGTEGTKKRTSSRELEIKIKTEVASTKSTQVSSSNNTNANNQNALGNPVKVPTKKQVVYNSPAGPYIKETKPNISGDVNTVWNLLLGCKTNNNSVNNSIFISSACNFFKE